MLPNPYRDDEHSHTWFHGTNADIDRLDSSKTTKPERNGIYEGPMTNKLLGTHFSPLHSVARSFLHNDNDAKIFHVHLDMDNPAHFADENHLNRAIFHHAVKHFPGFAEEKSDHHDLTNGAYAKKNRYTPDEVKAQGAGSGLIYQRHRDNAMENTLREHPQQKAIAKSFVDHLHANGHDGITYGNVFEAPMYHTCAIATDPDSIHIQRIGHYPAIADMHGKSPIGGIVPMSEEEKRQNASARLDEDEAHGEDPEITDMVQQMHNAHHDYGAPYNHSPDAPWGKSYTETHKLGSADEDYRMRHRPPEGDETGAPFHDPDHVMPGIHEHPEHYNTNMHYGTETISQLRAAKGNPDHPVTIYRALPRPHTTFRPGDWVTPSSRYADTHRYSESHEEGEDRDWHIIKATVPASHLHSHGDSPHEWGYTGPDTIQGEVHYDGPRRPGADYQDEYERENYPNPQRMTAATLDDYPQLMPHEWYHGSRHPMEVKDFDPDKDPYGEDRDTAKHWNSHLGTHWSSHHSVAREIGQVHGGRVYHATLDMKNPKHYDSEFDMDREALQYHLDNGESFTGNPSGLGSAHYTADLLTEHPRSKELAENFKSHIESQGHDGMTYGNEMEGPRGHTSAISFYPDQVHVTEHHLGHEGCRLHGPSCDWCGAQIGHDGKCEECGEANAYSTVLSPHKAARKPVRRDPKTGIEMCHKKVYGFPCRFLLGHAQDCDVDWDAAYPDEEEDNDGSHREAGRRRPQGRPQDQAPGEDASGEVAYPGAARSGPAELIFHPGVAKDRKRLDPQINRKVDQVLDSIANGTADPQTHAMGPSTPLKGWNATRVNHQVRITHRPGENGEILIGHIGQHNYDDAIRRLTVRDYEQLPLHPDLPTGMPDRGIIKGNPQLPIYRALSVHHGDREFDDFMDDNLGKAHYTDQKIAERLMGHITAPQNDRGVAAHVGLHWTHDKDWAEDYAYHRHSEDEQEPGTQRPVIVEAHHPGLEHAMSWDNPEDHKPLTKTVGEQQYDSAMLGEVPIRPGAPLHIRALHVGRPDGSFHRIPFSMHHQAALGDLSDDQREQFRAHFAEHHPDLDPENPMADWVHRAAHHQRGERALGPRRAEPMDSHPHEPSIDPYRPSWGREAALANGPLYHGTRSDLTDVVPGGQSGHHSMSQWVFMTNDLDEARDYARRAPGSGEPRVYQVEPSDDVHEGAVPGRYRASGATVIRRVEAGANGPDYDNLTFDDLESFGWPHTHGHRLLRAHHPDHGMVGALYYDEKPNYLQIGHLSTYPEHKRRGVATQMMRELESRYPGKPIQHGLRSDDGHAWAQSVYGTPIPENLREKQNWTVNGKEAMVRDVRSADSEAGAEDGIMIAIVPPMDLAERLSIEGGESPEQIHVTLAYLGKTGDYTQQQLEELPVEVERWARSQEPLEAVVQGAGTFVAAEEGGKHVLWASVDCPGLERLHVSLVDHLLGAGYSPSQNHVFVPHLTLSYEKHHVRFLPKISRESWTVNEVWVCIGGLWESLPLTVTEGARA